jgi:release factor glutamine methyltransferase
VFVQVNTVREIKKYFKKNLAELHSENEINQIVKESVIQRLGLTTANYLISDDQLVSESDLLFFRSIVKRIATNEPFQYIIGTSEFYGLVFKTDKRALIPRPETEELVDWINETYSQEKGILGMDLCAGSGCIAIALKSFFLDSKIMACELSEDAVELAIENSKKLNLPIEVIKLNVLDSSAFSGFKKESFDLWVSNPPYIPNSDATKMEANVLLFEPSMALFVPNEDPLIFYREIAKNGIVYLKKKGLLFFELNENYAAETIQLLTDIGFVNIELRKDLQGKDRMLKAQKP